MKQSFKRLNGKLEQFIEKYYKNKQLHKDTITVYKIIIGLFFVIGLECLWGGLMAKGHLFCELFSPCLYQWTDASAGRVVCSYPIPIGIRIWRLIYSPILMFLSYKMWPRDKYINNI